MFLRKMLITGTGCPVKLWKCPGQVGWSSGQPGLVEGVPRKGVELDDL